MLHAQLSPQTQCCQVKTGFPSRSSSLVLYTISIEYSSWSRKSIHLTHFTLNFQSPLSLAPIMWESPVGYPGFQVEHRLLMINISRGCSQKARCSLQDLFHHFFFPVISCSTTHTKTSNPAGIFSHLEGKVSYSSLIRYLSFKGAVSNMMFFLTC